MGVRVVSFKLEEDMYEILQEQAWKKKLTKSELIRRALRNFLAETEEKPYITRRIRVY